MAKPHVMWRRSGRRPWIDGATLTAAITYLLVVLVVAATYLAVLAAFPCPPGEVQRVITWDDGATAVVCADLP